MKDDVGDVKLVRSLHDAQLETVTVMRKNGSQDRALTVHLVTEDNLCDPASRRIMTVLLSRDQLAILVADLMGALITLVEEEGTER